MSTSEKITPNEGLDAEEDELPPPVGTRTRSGRRVRTPAVYLDSEVPKTPTRRTRKSVIQELPNENAENQTEPKPAVVVVEPVAEEALSKKLQSRKSKSNALATAEAYPKPVKSDKPVGKSLGTFIQAVSQHCTEKENKVGPVPMETVPDRPNKTAKKRTRSESNEKLDLIPLGKPKSGRVWKDRNKQRFSALVRDKPLCSSWEKKMAAKREKELVKKYSLQLKGDKAREKEEKRKRHEENLKRRAENERKAEVVQVIRNTTKIKRMKKKQLRKIEKRDTLAMLQKSRPRNPKVAQKGDK
ncbi:coiled-coil domain-containing protein 86 isoform X1 [Oncorhynchus mykiss]|uniref:Coiled-coil domain-containing protein 86 n=2 Tax=Oncorhynchus mykiss TaxID=8022 RepID=A0A8C7P8C0_ONCMY|nr:coiled-coil domain-containing protein 86 isoform X1 [Oncorhynchus mykiss]